MTEAWPGLADLPIAELPHEATCSPYVVPPDREGVDVHALHRKGHAFWNLIRVQCQVVVHPLGEPLHHLPDVWPQPVIGLARPLVGLNPNEVRFDVCRTPIERGQSTASTDHALEDRRAVILRFRVGQSEGRPLQRGCEDVGHAVIGTPNGDVLSKVPFLRLDRHRHPQREDG